MTATTFHETSEMDGCGDPRIARSRAKMIAAATELLVELGPRAVTVDAVAERSGVAKSTLYRHWDSRTALLVDVIHANVPVMEVPDLTGGFDNALRTVVRQFADAFADPEWARILPALFALKVQIPEMAELTANDHDEKLLVLQTVLDQGVREGRIPSDLDPARVASTLVGPLMFTCMTDMVTDMHELADYVVDRFIDSYANSSS
ncbi:MAG TPA: TetR/AcrR family transcriptional regulator [Ilumatobacter sp.]|nr:TetR/AcrR family transcriptional regulator [Ilumatobacter sp.]